MNSGEEMEEEEYSVVTLVAAAQRNSKRMVLIDYEGIADRLPKTSQRAKKALSLDNCADDKAKESNTLAEYKWKSRFEN